MVRSNATSDDKENDILFKLNLKVLNLTEQNKNQPLNLALPRPEFKSLAPTKPGILTGTYDQQSPSTQENKLVHPKQSGAVDSHSLSAQSSQAKLGKRGQHPPAVPSEGMRASEFEKLANRPTTRWLTNMQKRLLTPEVQPKPKTAAKIFVRPPPRPPSKSQSAKQPVRLSKQTKPKRPAPRAIPKPQARVIPTKPSKSPRDTLVMAKLNQMLKAGTAKGNKPQARRPASRGGRRGSHRVVHMHNQTKHSESQSPQRSKIEVKAEASSSRSAEQATSQDGSDSRQNSSDKVGNPVLRSCTKSRKATREEDVTSLPRFKCSSSSSSSSPERRPAPAQRYSSSKKKRGSNSRTSSGRGKYRKYSKEQKDRAILLALKENSYIKAAEIMKINAKNIKRWVTSGTTRRTGRH